MAGQLTHPGATTRITRQATGGSGPSEVAPVLLFHSNEMPGVALTPPPAAAFVSSAASEAGVLISFHKERYAHF